MATLKGHGHADVCKCTHSVSLHLSAPLFKAAGRCMYSLCPCKGFVKRSKVFKVFQ